MKQLLDWYQTATLEELICGLIVAAFVIRIVYEILTGKNEA